MNSFYKSKSAFLVALAILALSTITSANTCTESVFESLRTFLNPQVKVYYDSTHIAYNDYKFNIDIKSIYENGNLIKRIQTDSDNDTIITYFHYNSDESVLKKTGKEYIYSTHTKQDTFFTESLEYEDGVFQDTIIRKETSDYVVEAGSDYIHEFFLKQDTVIQLFQTIIENDTIPQYTTIDIADPDDEFKCYEYENDSKNGATTFYKPNEKGYSLLYTYENGLSRENFYIKKDDIQSIRKTIKPVKISPKARYFDLLGRYKYTK